jgi:hypothetical protein
VGDYRLFLLLRRDLAEEALREDDLVDDEPLRERDRVELPRWLLFDLDEPEDSPFRPDSDDS